MSDAVQNTVVDLLGKWNTKAAQADTPADGALVDEAIRDLQRVADALERANRSRARREGLSQALLGPRSGLTGRGVEQK